MSEPVVDAPVKATGAQLSDLHDLITRKRGDLSRAKRLSVLGAMVGRELSSSKRLTADEVERLTARLDKEPDWKVCPTPRKIRYATALAAGRGANNASVLRGVEHTPYPCDCGWWHTTTHARNTRLRVSGDGTVYWKRRKRQKGGK